MDTADKLDLFTGILYVGTFTYYSLPGWSIALSMYYVITKDIKVENYLSR